MIVLIHSFYPLLFENIDIDIDESDNTSFFEYSVYCLSLRICKYCLEYFAQNTKLDSLHTKSIIRALMISQYNDDPEYHTMIQLLLDYNLYNPFETYYFENDDDEFYIEHIHLIHSYYISKKACQESITALLGLKKCNNKVLGGNGKDVLNLLGKYIWDSRYEEKWGQKGHVIKRKFI